MNKKLAKCHVSQFLKGELLRRFYLIGDFRRLRCERSLQSPLFGLFIASAKPPIAAVLREHARRSAATALGAIGLGLAALA